MKSAWTGLVSLLLIGCATPQPVLELADKTSANVGVVSARLRQLADESDRLYVSRVDNISRLQAANATSRANLSYDLALTNKVGQQPDIDLIAEFKGWSQKVDDIVMAAADAERERRETLLAKQTRIDTKSQDLQKMASTLAALAKKESTAERVKTLRKFIVEVRDDMKQELSDGSDTARQAKALLDGVHSTLSSSPLH